MYVFAVMLPFICLPFKPNGKTHAAGYLMPQKLRPQILKMPQFMPLKNTSLLQCYRLLFPFNQNLCWRNWRTWTEKIVLENPEVGLALKMIPALAFKTKEEI